MNRQYPLIDHAAELRAVSGRPLSEVTLDVLEDLSIADVQISPATLRAQAEIARKAGFRQLATNLARAAELTAVPNAELLRMYELLRPQRASHAELLALAEELDQRYEAVENAQMVREAAEVYQARGLPRLHNLELFPQSPSLTLETYRAIGRNAARYAKGLAVQPVPVQVDNWARLRLIVKTTLLHRRETEQVREQPPMEWRFDWEPDV